MNYHISNDKLELAISDMGAEFQSIKKDGTEYLWNGDAKYWHGRSPLLFPYVGRFTGGKYLLNGREYKMGIHGFAKNSLFSAVSSKKDAVIFELQDSEETYKMYPYHFTLRVTYELQENEIKVKYRVLNRSDETMYFGIGGHPGFMVPLEDGLEFSDYYLEFGGRSWPDRVVHTPACYQSGSNIPFKLEEGKKIRLSHRLFDDDAIVLQNMADEVTLKSDKGTRKVKVSYPDMRYLGIWHAPETDAPYICIEPWTSLPSRQDIVEEFKYKHDLLRLAAGGEYSNTWRIAID